MEEKQSIFEELCLPHLDAAYNLARLLVGRDADEIEGWSYEQLASTLNVPPDTVVSRLSRARQRLRQELAWGSTEGVTT
jgi:Sigma-70, region 4